MTACRAIQQRPGILVFLVFAVLIIVLVSMPIAYGKTVTKETIGAVGSKATAITFDKEYHNVQNIKITVMRSSGQTPPQQCTQLALFDFFAVDASGKEAGMYYLGRSQRLEVEKNYAFDYSNFNIPVKFITSVFSSESFTGTSCPSLKKLSATLTYTDEGDGADGGADGEDGEEAPAFTVTHGPEAPKVGEKVTFTADAENDSKVSQIIIYVSGKRPQICPLGRNVVEKKCVFETTFTKAGTYDYYAIAKKANSVLYRDPDTAPTNKYSFTVVEEEPPTITVNHSPEEPKATDEVTITAAATDNIAKVKRINIYVGTVREKYCDFRLGDTEKTCSARPKNYTKPATYTYYAVATDSSNKIIGRDPPVGDINSFEVTEALAEEEEPAFTVTYDPEAPKVGEKVTFTADAGTDAKVSQIIIYAGKQKKACSLKKTDVEKTCDFETTFTKSGTYTYYAEAKDAKRKLLPWGRDPETGTKSFVVAEKEPVEDTIEPTVTVNNPPAQPRANQPIKISASAKDNAKVSAVAIFVDNEPVKFCKVSAKSVICSFTAVLLSPGSHSYYAKTIDTSLNVGTSDIKDFDMPGQAALGEGSTKTVTESQSPSVPSQAITLEFGKEYSDVSKIKISATRAAGSGCTSGAKFRFYVYDAAGTELELGESAALTLSKKSWAKTYDVSGQKASKIKGIFSMESRDGNSCPNLESLSATLTYTYFEPAEEEQAAAADTEEPAVTVTHEPEIPEEGQPVTITANAVDDSKVFSIVIFTDEIPRKSCLINSEDGTCTYIIKSYSSTEGPSSYYAKAADTYFNVGTSETVGLAGEEEFAGGTLASPFAILAKALFGASKLIYK